MAVTKTRQKNNLSLMLIRALIIIVVGMGGFFLYPATVNIKERAPTKAAQTYVDLLTAGNDTAAYNQSSISIKGRQTLSAFLTTAASLKTKTTPKILSKSIVLTSSKYALFTETVDGYSKDSSGSTSAKFVLGIIKQGNNWRVDSVDIY